VLEGRKWLRLHALRELGEAIPVPALLSGGASTAFNAVLSRPKERSMNKLVLVGGVLGAVLLVTIMTAADNRQQRCVDFGKAEARCLGPVTERRVRNGLADQCNLRSDVIFWTARDWLLLAKELAARPRDCTYYYISIPPTANDKKDLRSRQDELIRELGPRFRPVAEMTLGSATGWARSWVTGGPGRSWFDAGVEFRRRMIAAGYDFGRGETWLLNEADRSTRRNEPPYTRQAITDVVRGIAVGDGTGPVVRGIVELGIQFSHQTMPDLAPFKDEMKSLVADAHFWKNLNPYVSHFAREAYADVRRWGVAGSSRYERAQQLNDYFQHLMKLAENGPPEAMEARRFLRRTFLPLANATWPARAPEAIPPSPTCPVVYACGHGATQVPLKRMLSFVSEEVYAVRQYARGHPRSGPAGRIGFSWQPENNFGLPGSAWDAAKRSIAARIAEAIRNAYAKRGATAADACRDKAGRNWCVGASVQGARFTNAWADAARWD
jgi:hypothetical protein